MSRVRHVFISASRSDAPVAQELASRLEAAGIEVSAQALSVLPGDNFAAELGRALNRADAMIVLVSPASMRSQIVRKEIQYALGEERFQDRLIPVLVKDTPSRTIPWILRSFQWAKGNVDKAADQIVKALDPPKRREARVEAP